MIGCPACRSPMTAYFKHNVEVDRCGACAGAWFDAGELDAVTARFHEFTRGNRASAAHTCPRCVGSPLFEASVSGVPARQCARCRGIFLEVEQLGALARLPASRAAHAPGRRAPVTFRCTRCERIRPLAGSTQRNGQPVCGECAARDTADVHLVQTGPGLGAVDAAELAVDVVDLLLGVVSHLDP